MSSYLENPKTKGSGIICAIPQTGECPNKCEDCFFQSGRSYLEPLKDNLPNVPLRSRVKYRVVRMNDGNDSNVQRSQVENVAAMFCHAFFNTSIPERLEEFNKPVVLTINPGKMTDVSWHKLLTIPVNLMFVRFRVNTWNIYLADEAIDYYGKHEVPIVLTFMAYFRLAGAVPMEHRSDYVFRKRTINSYFAITTDAWRAIMRKYEDNKWVSSCGKIEGEKGDTHCRFCGVCLREYFATLERMETKNDPNR